MLSSVTIQEGTWVTHVSAAVTWCLSFPSPAGGQSLSSVFRTPGDARARPHSRVCCGGCQNCCSGPAGNPAGTNVQGSVDVKNEQLSKEEITAESFAHCTERYLFLELHNGRQLRELWKCFVTFFFFTLITSQELTKKNFPWILFGFYNTNAFISFHPCRASFTAFQPSTLVVCTSYLLATCSFTTRTSTVQLLLLVLDYR